MNAPTTPRAAEFLQASFPSLQDLEEIEREIKRKSRSKVVHYLHAELLWRVRRGESVTVERIVQLYPFYKTFDVQRAIDELRSWGFLSDAAPTLSLADHD